MAAAYNANPQDAVLEGLGGGYGCKKWIWGTLSRGNSSRKDENRSHKPFDHLSLLLAMCGCSGVEYHWFNRRIFFFDSARSRIFKHRPTPTQAMSSSGRFFDLVAESDCEAKGDVKTATYRSRIVDQVFEFLEELVSSAKTAPRPFSHEQNPLPSICDALSPSEQ
jgi:hypothetical protein